MDAVPWRVGVQASTLSRARAVANHLSLAPSTGELPIMSALNRREFLRAGTSVLATSVAGQAVGVEGFDARWNEPNTEGLVDRIDRSVIFRGRGGGTSWFHPRSCVVVGAQPMVLMTLQSISGSDVFGPVHWTTSKDLGHSWTKPEPIPGLDRSPLGDGWELGACDFVPEFHAPTKTVLAIGHNVYYRAGVLATPQRSRWPVYLTWTEEMGWSTPRRLAWDDERSTDIYTCGCSQRIMLPDGHVIIPFSFGPTGRLHRSVTSVKCSYEGRELRIQRVGTELVGRVKRGLLEPSLARLGARFYLTIRAEDDRGYVSVSDDGLNWEPQRPWCWEDGEPLIMSTTQQHWLTHMEGLFLVYTRRTPENAGVVRWRAPLFLAQVDRATMRLIRSTERVVLPVIGDGVNDPKHVALMGNFQPTAINPRESWVTVGENRPNDGWRGDTLLARIRWSRPNGLVGD